MARFCAVAARKVGTARSSSEKMMKPLRLRRSATSPTKGAASATASGVTLTVRLASRGVTSKTSVKRCTSGCAQCRSRKAQNPTMPTASSRGSNQRDGGSDDSADMRWDWSMKLSRRERRNFITAADRVWDERNTRRPSHSPHPARRPRSPTMSQATREFYQRSIEQPNAFWSEQAGLVHWHRPFDEVCDFSRPPFAKWFVGGETNICFNAVDRHLPTRAAQTAIHFHSSETGETRRIIYGELHREVNRFAAVLRSLGLERGDRAIIYLPMIPEAIYAMLACVRLGAIHSVVFGGFAAGSLASRIDDAEAKIVITADAGMRAGKIVPLKRLVDEALGLAKHKVPHVVVCDRSLDADAPMTAGRDHDYAGLRAQHLDARIDCVWVESSEPSYLLYTSGTTARPKGIQRDTGGYLVALASSMTAIFNCQPGETYFSTADVGWVVGHSYTVYGPLIHGMTTVLYEGLPIRPDAAIWWKLVEETKANAMFSSPTAVRVLKKQDPGCIKRHDVSSLRALYLAGEPLDETTSEWIRDALGVTIIDNYWQTETGWPLLTLTPGVGPVKVRAGSPGFPELRLSRTNRGRAVRPRRRARRKGSARGGFAAAAGLHEHGLAE